MYRSVRYALAVFVGGVLSGLCGHVPALAQDPAEADKAAEIYYSANALYNRGLYELAAKEYRAYLKAYPKHEKAARGRLGLALSLYSLGNFAEAGPLLAAAEQQVKGNELEQITVLNGQCLLKLDRSADAEEVFSRAARRNKGRNRMDALIGLAEALFRQQKWAELIVRTDEFLKTDAQGANASRIRFQGALARYRLEQFAEAATAFEPLAQAAVTGPLGHQSRFLLAECRRELGELDKAAAQYATAAADKDGAFTAEARFRLGLVRLSQKNYDEAITHLKSYLAGNPKTELTSKARLYLGQAYLEKKAFAEAESALKPLVQAAPPAPEASVWLARAYSRQNRMADAAAVLEAGLPQAAGTPHLPVVLFDLGHARLALDKFPEAAQAFTRILTDCPAWEQAAEALYLQALVLHRAGGYAPSLEACATFLKKYTDHERIPEAAFMQAENLLLLERDKEALAAYKAYIEKHGKHDSAPAARFRIAQLLHKDQKWEAALAESLPLLQQKPEGDLFRQLDFLVGDSCFNLEQWEQAVVKLKQFVDTQPKAPNRDVALLKLGLAHSRRKEAAPAIAVLQALAAAHPQSPQTAVGQVELGRLHYEAGAYPEARKAFQAALASKTDQADTRAQAEYYLGWIGLSEGKHPDAETHFRNVIEKHAASPLVADSLLQLATVQMKTGAFPAAETTIGRLVKEFKDFAKADHAVYTLGAALARQEKWNQAAPHFAAVISRFKDSPLRDRALYDAAWCAKRLDRPDEAITHYRALLEAHPNSDLFQRASFELAELQFEAGAFDDAIAGLAKLLPAVKDKELKEQVLYRLGWSYFSKENFAPAAKTFEALLREFPQTAFLAPAAYQAGEARMKLKEQEAARAHFEKACGKPQAKDVYELALLRLGETRALTGQWPQSEQSYQTFLQAFPQSQWIRRALLGLGWARENQKKYAEAMDAYGKVTAEAKRDETAARCQFQIGECLFAMQKHDEAIQALIKVSVAYGYPKWSAAALLETARALEQQGLTDKARAQYEDIVKDYPEMDAATVAKERLKALGVKK